MTDHVLRIRALVGKELLVVPSATGFVRDAEGRLLLMRHVATGTWVAPGGAVEPGETPAEACAREVAEETGVVVEVVELLGVRGGPAFRFTYPNGDPVEYVMAIFGCRAVGGSARPTDEATEVGWFTDAEAAGLDLADWLRHVLDDPRPF